MKLWRKIVYALLVLGILLVSFTLYQRQRAFVEYHSGPYHTVRSLQAPPQAQEVLRQLEAALQELQRAHPRLASIQRKYLGEPSEATQELYLAMAQEAWTRQDWTDWRRILNVLYWIKLNERCRGVWAPADLQALILLERRLTALESQARVLRKMPPPARPPIATEWTQNKAIAHRVLVNERVRRWQGWEDDLAHPLAPLLGLGEWRRARATLAQLNRWHGDLDKARPLQPSDPSLQLEPLREVLNEFIGL